MHWQTRNADNKSHSKGFLGRVDCGLRALSLGCTEPEEADEKVVSILRKTNPHSGPIKIGRFWANTGRALFSGSTGKSTQHIHRQCRG